MPTARRSLLAAIALVLAVPSSVAGANPDAPSAQETHDDRPLTDGALDLEHWHPKAKTMFAWCIRDHLEDLDTKKAHAQMASCMSTVRKVYEEPCQAPTQQMCTSQPYALSWCGRREYRDHGRDAKWVCKLSVALADRALRERSDLSRQTFVLPDEMSSRDGVTQHYRERVEGYAGEPQIEITHADGTRKITGGYFESRPEPVIAPPDVYVPDLPPAVPIPDQIPDIPLPDVPPIEVPGAEIPRIPPLPKGGWVTLPPSRSLVEPQSVGGNASLPKKRLPEATVPETRIPGAGIPKPGIPGAGVPEPRVPIPRLPARGPAGPRLSSTESAARTQWRDNGPAITSCDEYAYERFNDFSLLEDWARTRRHNPRQVFDAIYGGFAGHGPLVTSTGASNFRDTIGRLIPAGTGSGRRELEGGFRWAADPPPPGGIYDDGGPLGHVQRWRERTANAMAYLSWAARGVPGALELRYFAPLHRDAAHLLDYRWHKTQAANHDEYLDEELEEMYREQKKMWEVAERYVEIATERDGLSARHPRREQLTDQMESLWQSIQESLERGERYGCRTGGTSACGWAPSALVEALFVRYDSLRNDVRRRCIDRYGDGLLDEDAITGDMFFDARPLFPSEPSLAREAHAARMDYLRRDYLGRPDTFERLQRDASDYRNFVYGLFGFDESDIDGPFQTSSAFERRLGKEGIFSVKFSSDGAMGLRGAREAGAHKDGHGDDGDDGDDDDYDDDPGYDSGDDICGWGPYHEGNLNVNFEVFGASAPVLDMDNFVERIDEAFEETYDDEKDPEDDSGGGWGVGVSPVYKNELMHNIPCENHEGEPTNCSGASITAGVNVSYGGTFFSINVLSQLGPVTVSLTSGVSGSVGATIQTTASSMSVDGTPVGGTTTCENTRRRTISFQMIPSLGVSGFIAIGAGIAIFQVGIKGDLVLLQGSLPVVYTDTFDTGSGERTSEWTVDLVLQLLSGSISAYVGLNVGATIINIFKWTFIEWAGPRFQKRLLGDEVVQPVCWISELRAAGARAERLDGCTCLLSDHC